MWSPIHLHFFITTKSVAFDPNMRTWASMRQIEGGIHIQCCSYGERSRCAQLTDASRPCNRVAPSHETRCGQSHCTCTHSIIITRNGPESKIITFTSVYSHLHRFISSKSLSGYRDSIA